MNDHKMENHVHEWLNAYHDGELRGRKLDRVASHLAHCPECQQALAELDALSALLQSDPLPQISTTPEQFVGQVGLRLPRRTQAVARRAGDRRRLGKRWVLAPLGVMGMIWFIQAVTFATNLITGIEWLGISSQAVTWLVPAQTGEPNLVAQASMFALDWAVPFDLNIFLGLILPLLVAGFYLVWLVLLWIKQEDGKELQTVGSEG